jgi:hypothetical protein
MRIFIFILLLLLLSSCTSQKKENYQPSLNPENQQPYLIVEEHDPLHNQKGKLLNKQINNVEEIKGLINQIKTLKKPPKGPINCPLDTGINYDLKFYNIFNDTIVNVNATGCQEVKYNNEVFWALGPEGNQFRSYLLKILKISEKEYSGDIL